MKLHQPQNLNLEISQVRTISSKKATCAEPKLQKLHKSETKILSLTNIAPVSANLSTCKLKKGEVVE